jgi:hypothetical protein
MSRPIRLRKKILGYYQRWDSLCPDLDVIPKGCYFVEKTSAGTRYIEALPISPNRWEPSTKHSYLVPKTEKVSDTPEVRNLKRRLLKAEARVKELEKVLPRHPDRT